mmetsp:Transcript_7089/g.18365  ORF Transcript_7089/g.18365 Transcript_7089/m.18365 type:complete len:283 (-) Transcript_7089:378-1226(-)
MDRNSASAIGPLTGGISRGAGTAAITFALRAARRACSAAMAALLHATSASTSAFQARAAGGISGSSIRRGCFSFSMNARSFSNASSLPRSFDRNTSRSCSNSATRGSSSGSSFACWSNSSSWRRAASSDTGRIFGGGVTTRSSMTSFSSSGGSSTTSPPAMWPMTASTQRSPSRIPMALPRRAPTTCAPRPGTGSIEPSAAQAASGSSSTSASPRYTLIETSQRSSLCTTLSSADARSSKIRVARAAAATARQKPATSPGSSKRTVYVSSSARNVTPSVPSA